jgi:hypothetical protein
MTRCVDLVVPRRWRLAALANGRWPPFRAPINALKAPIGPALRVADRAPKSQLYRSRGGHYCPYKGAEDHDTWCVSKSSSCIDTWRLRLQAERLRRPQVRRAVQRQRGREPLARSAARTTTRPSSAAPRRLSRRRRPGGEGVEPLLLVGEGLNRPWFAGGSNS